MLAMFFIPHGAQRNKFCSFVNGASSMLRVKLIPRQAILVNPALVSAYGG
jgi:hypothetical protein